MKLSTMAAVMSFVSKIEEESAAFYEQCAEAVPEMKDAFLSWAKENRKFEKQVKQTYYGVITDTLESNFSFGGLDAEDFVLDTDLPVGAGMTEVAGRARAVEDTVTAFYLKAAQLSEGLMADIPRLFKRIVKKREGRRDALG